MSASPAVAPPPPPGRPQNVGSGSPTSPRRREHVPQPPVLTTSLSGLQFQGSGLISAGATPSTSLSSPFSQVNPSPYTPYAPSPGGALRGTSPMASRASSAYTTTYNPQEWGPVAGSPHVGIGPFPQVQQPSQQRRQQQRSEGGPHPSVLSLFADRSRVLGLLRSH
jgi:hypothetical protein